MCFGDFARPEIACHDDDGVLEIHHPSLSVGHASVVEHLEQRLEYAGMRLLDFVEQHHAVGLVSHGLGELSAIVISYVARRRSKQACHRVVLLVFAHVDAHYHVAAVEQILGQCLCHLGLSHASGAQEQERPDGASLVVEAHSSTPDDLGHRLHGEVLPDDRLLEDGLQLAQFLGFVAVDACHRNACARGDDLHDVVLVERGAQQGVGVAVHGRCSLGDVCFQRLDVSPYRHGVVIAVLLLGLLLHDEQLLQLVFVGLQRLQLRALVFPLGVEQVLLLVQIVDFGIERAQVVLAASVLQHGLPLNLFHANVLPQFVELRGAGGDGHLHLARRLVDDVDGLVGQVAVGDVAVREVHGGHDGLVEDFDAVVFLESGFHSSQDGDARLEVGLFDIHALKSPLKGAVVFYELAVFVGRSGSYHLDLSARHFGL